jgi:glycosyltransferase involved in cell wall biosynthesis
MKSSQAFRESGLGQAGAEESAPIRDQAWSDADLRALREQYGAYLSRTGSQPEPKQSRFLISELLSDIEVKSARIAALEELVTELQGRVAMSPSPSRLERLEEELNSHKAAKRNSDLEIIETRTLLRDAEKQIERSKRTFAYRLGQSLIDGFGSPGRALKLPFVLLALQREARRQSKIANAPAPAGASGLRPADEVRELALVREKVAGVGAKGAADWVRRRALNVRLAARLLVEIAREVQGTNVALAVELATEAVRLDSSENRVKWLALALLEAGEVTRPAELMRAAIRAGSQLTGTDQRMVEEIFALERILRAPPPLPRASVRAAREIRRVLLVAGQCLPHLWSTSTLRLHAMALAIQATGREAVVAMFPTQPRREADQGGEAKPRLIDGVPYYTLPGVATTSDLMDSFISEVTPHLATFARRHEVDAVQGTSGIVTGYLTVNVGRALGLPVILGFEGDEFLPRAPSRRGSERTERAGMTRALQRQLLSAAEGHILHLPLPQGAEGPQAAGTQCALFDHLPSPGGHSVEHMNRVAALRKNAALVGRAVLGFVGEASADYDLDMLAKVLADLALPTERACNAGLLLAGVGRRVDSVRAAAAARGQENRVLLVRRPAYGELASLLGAIDVFLAPLSGQASLMRVPLEINIALAEGLPVVAPDLPAAQEWLRAGLPIVIADGEDASALARAASMLVNDERRRSDCTAAVRSWSLRNTAPRIVGAALDELYRGLGSA